MYFRFLRNMQTMPRKYWQNSRKTALMQRLITVLRRSVTRFVRQVLDKLPYMLVVGAEEEEENGTVSVRSRFAGDEGVKDLSEFIDAICKEIRTKEIRKEEPQDQDNK